MLQIGSVRVGQVQDTPNLLILLVQNMGLKTSQFFITDVPLIVSSARTGPIENGFGIEKGSALKSWSKPWMTAPVASATLEVIPLLNFPILSELPKRH